MKLAYVTTYDATDKLAWSGTGLNMLLALQDANFDVEPVGSLRETYALLTKSKSMLYRKVFAKTYLRDRDPIQLADFARQVENRLSSLKYDMVFSPGTVPIAELELEKPIVFWTDATFAGIKDFYPDFSNLCAETIKAGNVMEQKALSKCKYAIYNSHWAAKTAIDYYDVNPEKIKVVPFGANIECNRKAADIELITAKKGFDSCNLLFIGVDWHRKGGEKALEVAQLLNKRGLETVLHIVGCTPPREVPDFVKCQGFLDKGNEKSKIFLEELICNAHFLIIPSIAECNAVAFAEASSFGLPVLATNVGGISTSIKNGKNGYTFDLNESSEKYCNTIENLMSRRDEYKNLADSSFLEYETNLNWKAAGQRVRDLLLNH